MILFFWFLSFLVLLISAGLFGCRGSRRKWFDILVDNRNRFSLSQLQISLWTLVVLSLLSGVLIARLFDSESRSTALNIAIPDELLIVMGISVTSAGSATVIKAFKNRKNDSTQNGPNFYQVFYVENETGDGLVDITKFQNFWFTLLVITAYVIAAIAYINLISSPSELTTLPGLDETWLTLLGVSHSGYIIGKIADLVRSRKKSG